MSRIPEDKIDEVRLAADIVEVISVYLPLRKRGRNYLALCPFHAEKTPSFSVSSEKQIYHCFGCGKGGNVFSFLMEYEKMSFVEAVRSLAEKYHIILPEYRQAEDEKYERLIYANQVAAEFFQKVAQRSEYRSKIGKYLLETRGMTPETISKFKIGFAPEAWQDLLDFAKKKDLSAEEMAEAGLAIKSEKKGHYFDRFRMRLMIPIFNLTGKIVAFGGRAMKKGEPAKYMNSPETPIYHKSRILYGMHVAKTAIRDAGAAVLVEGYFDMLSLYQAGIENVVAVSGTAFTTHQARLIARFAPKAYLFFDADSAGRNAALKSVEVFFNAGIEPIIVTPPPKQDPDSIVRDIGADGVRALFEKGLPYLAFRFEKVNLESLTMREKEQIVNEIKAIGSRIDDIVKQDIFFASAASHLNLTSASFQTDAVGQAGSKSHPTIKRNINVIESEFLSLLAARPNLIEQVWNDISPEDLRSPEMKSLYARMMESYRAKREINPERLIEQIEDETEKSALTFLSTIDWGDLDLSSIVLEYKRMILNQKREAKIIALRGEVTKAEKEGNHKQAVALLQEIKYLLDKRD